MPAKGDCGTIAEPGTCARMPHTGCLDCFGRQKHVPYVGMTIGSRAVMADRFCNWLDMLCMVLDQIGWCLTICEEVQDVGYRNCPPGSSPLLRLSCVFRAHCRLIQRVSLEDNHRQQCSPHRRWLGSMLVHPHVTRRLMRVVQRGAAAS
jgi:hypothetical protein